MRAFALPGLLVLATLIAGCAGCSGAQGYGGQQGLCNAQDHFTYGIQGTKSGTERYDWQNTGTAASVQWGGQGSGSFTVTIEDAAGQQVYSRSFGGGQAGSHDTTSRGRAGLWHIDLTFTGFSGQGGLDIQRA
jgi:hypothetical protein